VPDEYDQATDEFTWSDHVDRSTKNRAAARRTKTSRSVVEWMVVAIVALVITLVLRTFVLAAFSIPSVSMVPTLQVGDRVLVNKLSYKAHAVHRGDVVVFKRPPGEPDLSIKDLIKRVIGLPGETVSFRDGKVFVNDQALTEPYLPAGVSTVPLSQGPSIKVPVGEVLVLGDNRESSFDGRAFGPFDQKLIVGRAFVKVWPPSRLGSL
jgi:signal peptidase I